MVSVTTHINTPITSPITTPRNRSTTPSPSPRTIHSPNQTRASTPASVPRTPPKQIITPSTTTPPPAPRKPIPFGAESVKFVKNHQLEWDFHVLKTTVLMEVRNGAVANVREVKQEVGRDKVATVKANPAVNKELADKKSAAADTPSRKVHASKDPGAKEGPGKRTATTNSSSGKTRSSAPLNAARIEKVLEWREGVPAAKPVEMKVVCGMVVEVMKSGVKAKTQPAGMKEAAEEKEGMRKAVKGKGVTTKKDQGRRKTCGRKGVEGAAVDTGAGCAN